MRLCLAARRVRFAVVRTSFRSIERCGGLVAGFHAFGGFADHLLASLLVFLVAEFALVAHAPHALEQPLVARRDVAAEHPFTNQQCPAEEDEDRDNQRDDPRHNVVGLLGGLGEEEDQGGKR